jgi:hypothetical protein
MFRRWLMRSMILFSSVAVPGQSKQLPLRTLLKRQGFTGTFQPDVEFTPLGRLQCQSKTLRVIYYVWTDAHPISRLAIHAQQRLILIDGNRYVGSYVLDDRPIAVRDNKILFGPMKYSGDEISCGVDGLPKTVVVNGHLLELDK